MSHFAVFYPRCGGRYLSEIIYSISLILGFRGSWVQGFMGSGVHGFKGSGAQGFMGSRAQGFHYVRSSIPDMRISMGDWNSFLNTAKQCLNAERSEAIERHKVPLEFLIAEGV